MQLLAGLGNPGTKHENDRHNIGFMAVERFARRHNFSSWSSKFQGLLCEGQLCGEKVLCLKPQTFMNLSGQSVGEVMRFYKLEAEALTVIYDELDLPLGKVRVKTGGGAGGHNGIKSIDGHVGKEYRRVRIGIDHPGDKKQVTNYVLGSFSKAEVPLRDAVLDAVADCGELLVAGNDNEFMNRVALMVREFENGI